MILQVRGIINTNKGYKNDQFGLFIKYIQTVNIQLYW